MASLIRSLVPQPAVRAEQSETYEDVAARDQLLLEVKQKLKIRTDDMSEAARGRVLDYLTAELSAPVLKTERGQAAKERLGARGALAPARYRVLFTDAFKLSEERRGIRRKDVEATVLRPHAYQHLLTDRFRDESAPTTSLYLTHHGSPGASDRYTLIVHTDRKGSTQHVLRAWRVYHSDVDLSRARAPLDVLEAFVDEYGIPIYVGESKSLAKFTLYHKFRPVQEPDGREFYVRGPGGPVAPFAAQFTVKHNDDGTAEMAMVYSIDIGRYFPDLRKHGVRVTAGP